MQFLSKLKIENWRLRVLNGIDRIKAVAGQANMSKGFSSGESKQILGLVDSIKAMNGTPGTALPTYSSTLLKLFTNR